MSELPKKKKEVVSEPVVGYVPPQPADNDSTTVAVAVWRNAFVMDLNGRPVMRLTAGRTYRFDQSDKSNAGEQIRFTMDAAGQDSANDVSVVLAPGTAGAYTEIKIPHTLASLHYSSTNTAGLGNRIVVEEDNHFDVVLPWDVLGDQLKLREVTSEGHDHPMLEVTSLPGSDALFTPVKKGDLLVAINDKHVDDMSHNEVQALFSGGETRQEDGRPNLSLSPETARLTFVRNASPFLSPNRKSQLLSQNRQLEQEVQHLHESIAHFVAVSREESKRVQHEIDEEVRMHHGVTQVHFNSTVYQ
jgi:hypothetical protein